MATSHESADLLLKLYDLRREARLREARSWFAEGFNPDTVADVTATLESPNAAYFRMVVTYWDMAAGLVNHGAVDEVLFNDVTAEHVMAFAKVEPFLADLRLATGNPRFLGQLEQLVMRLPNVKQRLDDTRERFHGLARRPEPAPA